MEGFGSGVVDFVGVGSGRFVPVTAEVFEDADDVGVREVIEVEVFVAERPVEVEGVGDGTDED